MANPDIGTITCPCCDFAGAHVRQTAKGRAYIVCDECSSQTFARGSVSDASVRRRMIPIVAVPVQPDPAPDTPPEKKPKKRTAAAVSPAPTPEPKAGGFGNWLNL